MVFFVFNGLRPLMDTSEARYAEVAREMAVDGQWLVPHSIFAPHLTKPPLSYWCVAAAMKLFGRSEFCARLMSGVFALLTALITGALAQTLYRNRSTGIAACWCQLLAVFPLVGAHVITTDTFLVTFELGQLWCLWSCLRCGEARAARSWAVGSYAFLAAAFMTKGPAGLVLLAPVVVFWGLTRKQYPWRRLLTWQGVVLFLVLGLSWYVFVLVHVPGALGIWRKEALVNVLENANHRMPRLLSLPLLLVGSLPGGVVLPWAVRRQVRTENRDERQVALFLTLWLVIPLVILMAQKTRLPLYLLPLVPPFSILCGREIALRFARSEDVPSSGLHVPRWVAALVFLYVLLVPLGKLTAANCLRASSPERDFRPMAEFVRHDSLALHTTPELVLGMRYEGHGLVYYLNGPPARRLFVELSDSDQRRQLLAALLALPVTPGHTQYLIMSQNDQRRYEKAFADAFDALPFSNKWVVWRRKRNEGQTVSLPTKEQYRKNRQAFGLTTATQEQNADDEQ